MKNRVLLFTLIIFSLGAEAQTNEQKTILHNGVIRNYTIHLPTAYNSNKTLPLVINMHGLGGDINSHMLYSNFNTISDTGNFIVVYPQGLFGTTTWGQSGNQWDSYFGTGTKDLEFLDTLIDQMFYEYNIDLTKVYSTGHSNGGYMSYRLACELSDRIAAIASVGGAMTFQQENNCNIEHPMPILQIHGTDDATVLYGGIPLLNSSIPDLMNFWKAKNNCTSDSTLFAVPNTVLGDSCSTIIYDFSNCDSFSQVQLYKVINGGHSWPGAFDYPPLGNTCQDFNASSVIWNFFNKYKMDNPTIPEDNSIDLSINLNLNEVKVFPAPFDQFVNVDFSNDELSNISSLKVINLMSEEFDVSYTINENSIRIDGSNLSKGVYFLIINDITVTKLFK